jgi:superfamily II DNA/RNA helicase
MLDMGFIPDIEEICTKLPPTGRPCSSRRPCRADQEAADKFLLQPQDDRRSPRPRLVQLLIDQRVLPSRPRARSKDALVAS